MNMLNRVKGKELSCGVPTSSYKFTEHETGKCYLIASVKKKNKHNDTSFNLLPAACLNADSVNQLDGEQAISVISRTVKAKIVG